MIKVCYNKYKGLAMKLKAQIIRTKRKSLSLKITNDGNLEIHAPLKMKTEDIEQFIKSKSN